MAAIDEYLRGFDTSAGRQRSGRRKGRDIGPQQAQPVMPASADVSGPQDKVARPPPPSPVTIREGYVDGHGTSVPQPPIGPRVQYGPPPEQFQQPSQQQVYYEGGAAYGGLSQGVSPPNIPSPHGYHAVTSQQHPSPHGHHPRPEDGEGKRDREPPPPPQGFMSGNYRMMLAVIVVVAVTGGIIYWVYIRKQGDEKAKQDRNQEAKAAADAAERDRQIKLQKRQAEIEERERQKRAGRSRMLEPGYAAEEDSMRYSGRGRRPGVPTGPLPPFQYDDDENEDARYQNRPPPRQRQQQRLARRETAPVARSVKGRMPARDTQDYVEEEPPPLPTSRGNTRTPPSSRREDSAEFEEGAGRRRSPPRRRAGEGTKGKDGGDDSIMVTDVPFVPGDEGDEKYSSNTSV
jgi:cell division protein FtsB